MYGLSNKALVAALWRGAACPCCTERGSERSYYASPYSSPARRSQPSVTTPRLAGDSMGGVPLGSPTALAHTPLVLDVAGSDRMPPARDLHFDYSSDG